MAWNNDNEWWEIIGRKEMEVDYAEFLEERSKLASVVAAYTENSIPVRFEDKLIENVGLNGATSNFLNIQGLDITLGRMFTENEVRSANKVAIIGVSINDEFFENNDPLGKQVRIGGQKFTVIGGIRKTREFPRSWRCR